MINRYARRQWPAGLAGLAGAMLLGLAAVGGPLSGVVLDTAGRPAAGVQVRRLAAPAGDAVTTALDGRFELALAEPGPAVLELAGPAGAGRVRLSAVSAAAPLELRYPVVEHIVFLHSNDHHFDFNARDRFAAVLQETRAQYADVFYLNAGDIFVWRPLSWRVRRAGVEQRMDAAWDGRQALAMVGILNDLGCAAMTLGNHELAFVGRHTGAALATARFPLLGANLELDTEALPAVQPFMILRTATDRTIAVLGLTTDTSRMRGVNQLPLLETAARYLHLKQTNDLLVALTHIGFPQDKLLAENFPELDVIIGGHTHDPRVEMVGPVLVAGAKGVLHTVSCDRNPNSLGKIVVTLENGRVVDKSGEIMMLDPEPAAAP